MKPTHRTLLLSIALLVILMQNPATTYAATLYGSTAGPDGTGSLYILDPADGSVISTVGAFMDAFGSQFAVTGLAFDPVTGVLYGSTSNKSSTAPQSLIAINPLTAQVTVIGSFNIDFHGEPQTMADITFTPDGTLYGWAEPYDDDLYTINPATGEADLVGDSGLETTGSGLASNAAGILYFTGTGDTYFDDSPDGLNPQDEGTLLTISAADGSVSSTDILSGGTNNLVPINALAFNGPTLYGIINDRNHQGWLLTAIDTATGDIDILGQTIDRMDGLAFIPEPASFALLSLGALALLRKRRS
jgi:PEP-CTERM motif